MTYFQGTLSTFCFEAATEECVHKQDSHLGGVDLCRAYNCLIGLPEAFTVSCS